MPQMVLACSFRPFRYLLRAAFVHTLTILPRTVTAYRLEVASIFFVKYVLFPHHLGHFILTWMASNGNYIKPLWVTA